MRRSTGDRQLQGQSTVFHIATRGSQCSTCSSLLTYPSNMPTDTLKTWTHAESASAGRPLTEEIARDHETLRQCHENYKKATTNDEKQEWANQYVWTNARHAIAEGKAWNLRTRIEWFNS